MKTITVGVISCKGTDEVFFALGANKMEKFYLKKIFVRDNISEGAIRAKYPEAEIVNDVNNIMNDAAIELVIFSAPNVNNSRVVGDALQAGKHVRII